MIMRRNRKTKMTRWLCAAILVSALCGGALAQTTAVKVDSETVSGAGGRNSGSGGVGGGGGGGDRAPGGGGVAGAIAPRRGGGGGGDRRRAGGAAADGLHRLGERRRVEVGQRRHDIQTGLRQTTCPIHRRGHD